MPGTRSLRDKLLSAHELSGFLWEQKRRWMMPMVIVLLLFTMLIVATRGSAIAPYIFTLF